MADDDITRLTEALRKERVEHAAARDILKNGDVGKLTKALHAERNEHKATALNLKTEREQHTAAKTALETATAKLTQIEALGLDALPANPNAEQLTAHVAALAKVQVASSTAELQKQLADQAEALGTAQNEATTMRQTLDSVRIASAVKDAARALHVKPDAVNDLLTFATLELKCDGDRVVSKDGVDVADWLDAQKSTRGYLWPTARGSGARGSGDGVFNTSNPFKAGSQWNMTEQGRLARTNPAMAARLAAEAGVPLGKP